MANVYSSQSDDPIVIVYTLIELLYVFLVEICRLVDRLVYYVIEDIIYTMRYRR
jgi:hypothetical protein